MINIENYINIFSQTLNNTFGKRIWFVGLQGSYARGEATNNSDIDIVVILDELSVADIISYNNMLDSLPFRELMCGFLSGKNEIMNWEVSDLFQFCYDTKPIKGNLNDVIALIDNDAVERAVKTGTCNIYHGCVHNMLYEKSDEIIKGLYKSATFVIQAKHFRQTSEYINTLKNLIESVSNEDSVILQTFSKLKKGDAVNFEQMSECLFNWAKLTINNI